MSGRFPIVTERWRTGELVSIHFKNLGVLKKEYPFIKVVLCDKYGGNLIVSNAISITDDGSYYIDRVHYHVKTNTIEAVPFSTPMMQLFGRFRMTGKWAYLLFRAVTAVALSIIVELGIAILFGLRKRMRFIIFINGITQCLLTLAIYCLPFPYWRIVVCGEILVFLIEGFVYMSRLHEHAKWRVALYTIVANTISLGIGLLVNYLW